MINSLNSKQLGIVLPNTNKALSEALKSASPKQLESVSSFKDLKSMMSSILKQSTTSSSSDKVLLELVKNNPTLKNLGSVSSTIKDLLNSLKSDKNQLPIEKTLKNLLLDIKDLKGSELKQKLIHSDATIKQEKETVSIEKTIKNLLSEIKNEKTIKQEIAPRLEKEMPSTEKTIKNTLLKTKDAKTVKNEEKTPTTNQPLKSEKESVSIEKTLKTILADATKDVKNQTIEKDFNPKTMQKVTLPLEKIVKSFLTDAQTLKGSQLKQKLTELTTFLESNFKNTNTSSTALKDIVSSDLKNLLSPTEEKKESSPIEKVLKNFLVDIKDLKGSELKHKLLHSGVFLEANIKNAKDSPEEIKEITSKDLKVILHKASEEIIKSSHPNQQEVLKQIDKLSLQIDNYQLLSYLSNGSSLYLPFSWDQLQEGDIEIKKLKNDKFFCDINLKLKDFGEVNLKLALYETNQLNLHFHSGSQDFRELVKQNIPELRSALIDVNITPREIRVFQPKPKIQAQTNGYGTIDDNLQMGFEIKV